MYAQRETETQTQRDREYRGIVACCTADEPKFKEEHLLCCHYNFIKTDSYAAVQNSHHHRIICGHVCVLLCVCVCPLVCVCAL